LAKAAAKRCEGAGDLAPPEADATAVSVFVAPGSPAWRSAVTLRTTVAAAIAGVSGTTASDADDASFSSTNAAASPKARSPTGDTVASAASVSNPLNCAFTGAGSSVFAARGARRAARASSDAPSASIAPTAANTTSGNSKPCNVPCRTSIFIASSVARVGSSGNRSRVLSSREASLSCARRCAERAARASLFSVSVETVA
jgi:hypothetical protein